MDRQTERQQDDRVSEERSGPRTKIHNMAEALRRGLKPRKPRGKSGVPSYLFLGMGRFPSTSLKPDSPVPRQEVGEGDGEQGEATSTHFDVNSLPRRETLAPGVR